jgi:hypothetical protein
MTTFPEPILTRLTRAGLTLPDPLNKHDRGALNSLLAQEQTATTREALFALACTIATRRRNKPGGGPKPLAIPRVPVTLRISKPIADQLQTKPQRQRAAKALEELLTQQSEETQPLQTTNLLQSARRLLAFLDANVQPIDAAEHQADEWPIRIVADNSEDAEQLARLLQDLQEAVGRFVG